VVFSHLAAAAVTRGRRICILVHRVELIEQTSRTLGAWGIAHGIIAPDWPKSSAPVQIASVMTLVRRLRSWKDAFDFLVADEAHHAVAASWQTILDAYPAARVLGVTATPERLDGRGLGEFFEELVSGPSVAELTKLGFLAPAVIYAPQRKIDLSGIHTRGGDYDRGELEERMLSGGLVGDAALHYRKLASGVPAIAFCVGIKHSLATAEAFVKAGYRARHVDGSTPPAERRAAMAGLAAGELAVVTNCALISEAFDAPAVGALSIMRPTQSLGLHLQMIGRALRPSPGKDKAIILDHAGNVFRHGLPDQDRIWSLAAAKRKPPGRHDAPVKRCPECRAIIPAGAVLAWAGADRTWLRRVAEARNYKPGWVYHRMLELEGAAA
jgi:superfamily II DNA or RNA helicase